MAAIVTDTTVTLPDGSTVETITYADGSKSVQYTPFPGTPAANLTTIQARAQTALAANATYQAINNPTTNQAVAQVALLTKEVNALLKLALGLLSDVTGT